MTERRIGRIAVIGYRPDLMSPALSGWLDHLRWLSALMVAVSHTRNLLLPDAQPGLNAAEKLLYFFTLFATQSVVIFFVLSGLLVGGTIVRRFAENRFAFREYLIDRAARLYVGLVPALGLAAALQWAGQSLQCTGVNGWTIWLGNLAFLQNFRIGAPPCNNGPLWSLSSEAFFYLLFPLVLIAVLRRSPAALVASGLLIVASLVTYIDDRSWTGFGLVLWLAGLLPWFFKIRIPAAIMALPVVAVLLATRFHLLDFRTGELILAIALALLLCSDFSRMRVPFPRWGSALAAFSFSLYLVHMPIAQSAAMIGGYQGLPNGEARSYLIYAGTIMAMIAVGWLFGRLFEARTGDVRRAARRLLLSARAPVGPTRKVNP